MKKQLRKKYYWSPDDIIKKNCTWNVVFGERSNGKTYGVLDYFLDRYLNHGYQMAIIRRWRVDFQGKRGQSMFDSLECNGFGENVIKKKTKGRYDCVHYYAGKWYLAKYDHELDKKIPSSQPFAIAFSLTEYEHDKSTSYPKINSILMDEALSRNPLPDEFTLMTNVLSTIIRDRGPEDDIKIFLLGNTVNKYSPLFSDMGLTRKIFDKMKPGQIDIYKYEGSELTVAVEYCQSSAKFGGKKSDVFFAFNTAATKMITTGAWEIPSYPHNVTKFEKNDILFYYFIKWQDQILQCEIVSKDDKLFTFIHTKTTEIQDESTDIIFDQEYHQQRNYFRNIARPTSKLQKRIWWFFQSDNVYYQDNEVGELVRNYIQWCKSDNATT